MENDTRTLVNDYAIENFKNGLNCAESVYDALIRSGVLKAPKETVAMCTGFGGGIGLSGYVCGALSAAVMANGAMYGRVDPMAVEQQTRKKELAEKYYRRYNKMTHDFAAQNGSVLCREICKQEFHSKERRVSCMKIVANTAVLAYDYLTLTQEDSFALPYGEKMGGKDS